MTLPTFIKTRLLLYKIIKDFKQIDKSIDYINNGGCGLFAEYAYEMLIKLGYNPQISILTNDFTTAYESVTNNKSGFETPFSHIIIELHGVFIDSAGFYISKRFIDGGYYNSRRFAIVKGLTLLMLKQWNTENIWNSRFNRIDNASLLKEKIKALEEKYLVN